MAWKMKDPAKQLANMDKIRSLPAFAPYLEETSGDAAFALWLILVDRHLNRKVGVSHSDLGDFNSWDLYDAGVSPAEGALECLENDDTYAMFVRNGDME